MATPHLLASAAIGRGLQRRPLLAVATAFAFHFVLDATPHLDSNDLFGSPAGFTGLEVGIAIVDFVLACVLIGLLIRGRAWWKMALWGAFSGIVLDLVDTIPPVGPWFVAWRGTAWLNRLHHGIQPDVPSDQLLLGFGTQAVVIAVSAWFLLRRDRDQEK